MSVHEHTRRTILQLGIRLLFVVVPTIVIGYVTLGFLNASYTALATNVLSQALFFGLGLTAAYILYFYRARFVVTFILLILLYWLIEWIINHMPGEFEMFFTMARFKLYSTLFIAGWIFGYLLAVPLRVFGMLIAHNRHAYIIISTLLALVTITSVSDTGEDITTEYVAIHLLPVFLYAMYMLFISPRLVDSLEMDAKQAGRLSLRALAFLVLVAGTFWLVDYLNEPELRKIREELEQRNGKDKDGNNGPDGYDERKGLLERGNKGDKKGDKGKGGKDPKEGGEDGDDGESGYKLKDTMTMSDRMSQADYVMFCSKLKNYFPDGSPKPLYFVYHYLTKYDAQKESFVRDPMMPFFDELNVDPSSLPMYRSKTDSTVIKNSLATKKRKVVETEVFVSSNTWKHALLAPAGAFYCQTIPVDSSYGKMFRSAYKVKSYASDLNNAYFVYNPSANPMLEAYQEERYDELRSVKNYNGTDSSFYVYYTQMPKGVLYDSIDALAKRITANAKTPVDKVLAIRDHFLQTDKEGKRIFRYTLTPGAPSDPNIPNASMLGHFLFRTHAGYCTYYAGASLFLLRSVGIPSRFTTGFATIDRSDKNKGWYWFYASQAHAWTQVYFPGYGWLDFDMTVGNEEQREAPSPDGTPPLPPPEPWLVLEGRAETAADAAKMLDVSFNKIIFFNEDFRLGETKTRTVNASVCRVLYGKKDTTLSAIHPGDSIIVISYDDIAKEVPEPRSGVSIDTQVDDFPKPIIADEIHIRPKPEPEKKETEKKEEKKVEEKKMTWLEILVLVGWIAGGIVVVLFLIPSMWLLWLLLRAGSAGNPKVKADRVYRLALYHFHMAGKERGTETPLQYAMNTIDPYFQAGFTGFMQVYLRLKYSGGQLMPGDQETINNFGKRIRPAVRRKTGFFPMLGNYFRLARANRFFRRPAEHHQEAQQPSL